MAILAGYPVVTVFPDVVDPLAESRTISFRSLDGTQFLPCTGREFVAMQGILGFDLVTPNIVEAGVPGMDGTRITDITYGSRDVSFPMFLASTSSHLQYLSNRATLRRLFNPRAVDYRTTDGTFDLVSTSGNPANPQSRSLRCTYKGGWEGSREQDRSGAWWEKVVFDFLAVQPYWKGTPWSTEIISVPAAVSFFGTFPPSLSSSRALGSDIAITVPGDAPSWLSVDLVGPASSFTVTAPGLSLSVPAGLGSGETATLVTDPRGRTMKFNGVTNWARVAPSDRYRLFLPGDATINVTLTGATAASSARVYGDTFFETAF